MISPRFFLELVGAPDPGTRGAISRAHSDLQNLMAATDIGTLFLDAGLHIKRFTEHVALTPADLVPIRRELANRSGKWFDMRMRPYRTVDDKIDGVVITFVDISERRQVEEQLRESERQLREFRDR